MEGRPPKRSSMDDRTCCEGVRRRLRFRSVQPPHPPDQPRRHNHDDSRNRTARLLGRRRTGGGCAISCSARNFAIDRVGICSSRIPATCEFGGLRSMGRSTPSQVQDNPGVDRQRRTSTTSQLLSPWGLTVDDAGVVIFSESPSSGRGGRVWRLRTDGIAEVIAGTGAPGKSGDGGSAPGSHIQFPGRSRR